MNQQTVPDSIEPIRAYRLWNVTGPYLSAVTRDSIWYPGTNEAYCNKTFLTPSHVAPVTKCTCGYYGRNDGRDLQDIITTGSIIAGSFLAWGQVEEYNRGIRAQYVSIEALSPPYISIKHPTSWYREHLSFLSMEYGVPFFSDIDELMDRFPPRTDVESYDERQNKIESFKRMYKMAVVMPPINVSDFLKYTGA